LFEAYTDKRQRLDEEGNKKEIENDEEEKEEKTEQPEHKIKTVKPRKLEKLEMLLIHQSLLN